VPDGALERGFEGAVARSLPSFAEAFVPVPIATAKRSVVMIAFGVM